MGELDGKVAIVTGAGRLRGIGRATAIALAEMGADIVPTGTGRAPDTFPPDEQEAGWRDIESTAEQVRALGRRALPLVCDVSRSEDVDRTVRTTLDELGRVDILINNAAFRRGEDRVTVDELPEEVWRRVIDIKVTGTFLMSKAVGSVLIEQGQGGRIINLSSTVGKQASARAPAYSTANFAVQGFAQVLAKWLAPHGISCNAVCPGVTDTSRMDDLGYPRGERWDQFFENVPLKRVASDDEIAGVIAFLCTPAADYITGQAISVDGGMTMG
jgi:3-oxoacyl-[acyl-carrier protein] reductase/meso-butanediol dehydrogenase/(S,S)-butanediol dehydrogenase/diacetyl reductase